VVPLKSPRELDTLAQLEIMPPESALDSYRAAA
jgi:hypothetical protein